MLHPKVARIGWPLKNSQLDALSLLLACQSQMEMYRIAAVGIYSVYYTVHGYIQITDRDIQNSCSGGADKLSRLKCWNVFRQSVLVSFVCLVSLILNSIYLFLVGIFDSVFVHFCDLCVF